MCRETDVRLNADSRKWYSTLYNFGNFTIRRYDVSTNWFSTTWNFGKTTNRWNDVSGKWGGPKFIYFYYFDLPYWIYSFEFLSSKLRSVISGVRNLKVPKYHRNLLSHFYFLFINFEFTESSPRISKTVKKRTKILTNSVFIRILVRHIGFVICYFRIVSSDS